MELLRLTLTSLDVNNFLNLIGGKDLPNQNHPKSPSQFEMSISIAIISWLLISQVHGRIVFPRAFHLGGSLTNNEEVITIEQVPVDQACNQVYFTQNVFGRSATALALDLLFPFYQTQVGPLGVKAADVSNYQYRIQFARWNSTVLQALDPYGVVPTLAQQIDQVDALFTNCPSFDFYPNLFTITSGANDAAAIFEEAVALLEQGQSETTVQAFITAEIGQVIGSPTEGLATKVNYLLSTYPGAKIIIGNIPDLTLTPLFLTLPATLKPLFQSIIVSLNQEIADLVGPRVSLWNLYGILESVLAGSKAPYTTTPCENLCSLSSECIFADSFHPSFAVNVIAGLNLESLIQ